MTDPLVVRWVVAIVFVAATVCAAYLIAKRLSR